jgi:ligand-binding sensor domain-containing protein
MGSYDDGLIEMNAATMKGRTRNANGPTGKGPKINPLGVGESADMTKVAGVAFDKNGVLWCTNSSHPEALHAIDRAGNVYDFNFQQLLGNTHHIGEIIAASNGYIYAVVVNKGLLVFDYNETLGNTNDDNFKLMTDADGNGKFPSANVLCVEEDLDGEIWVGTEQGFAIIYSPESIFSQDSYNAEQIFIQQDGNTQILLATEAINAIEIDGSNRKWIGTRNSGAFLFSDDGLRQIYHFHERNSPIASNNVSDVAINHANGEVFFGTEKGIMGFFSTATNFDNEMKEVKVFPNPVRPDYEGNITIDGLAYDTNVKVTDIQGNIVYETMSEGGRAIWNGRRFDGERPATGVYLIYVTDKNGKADDVKKITFIR